MLNIVSPGFNESLDDYLHRRQDKSKLSKNVYFHIKSKKSKESPFSTDDYEVKKKRVSAMNLSIFSFFRKRIPTDGEVIKKEHEKQVAQERAEMEDDDENMQPRTQNMPKTQVVEDDDDFENYEDVAHKMHNAPKDKKEGSFMNKLFNFGNSKKEDDEREDVAMQMQTQQQNIEDLKETIKVLHRWLEKLPADKISEFKRSPDFEKYKDGLRKLGLIKE